MWTNTIGSVDPQAGSNSVIEASLNAPQFGGGRAARRAAAQEAVAQTGTFSPLLALLLHFKLVCAVMLQLPPKRHPPCSLLKPAWLCCTCRRL